jgi:hypothetical protein
MCVSVLEAATASIFRLSIIQAMTFLPPLTWRYWVCSQCWYFLPNYAVSHGRRVTVMSCLWPGCGHMFSVLSSILHTICKYSYVTCSVNFWIVVQDLKSPSWNCGSPILAKTKRILPVIILSWFWVTVEGVWIGNWIYWTLTDHNYK